MDDRLSPGNGDEQNRRTGWNELFKRLYRPGPLLVFFAVAFGLMLWLAWSLLQPPSAPSIDPPAPELVQPAPPPSPASIPYEEPTATTRLEDEVFRVDLVLAGILRQQGDGVSFVLENVEVRSQGNSTYHFQEMRVPAELEELVRQRLAALEPEVTLAEERVGRVVVSVGPVATHRLLFERSSAVPPPRPPAGPDGPRMAIVIDDLGEDLGFARGLAALPVPVAFSVWPMSSHAAESARIGTEAGQDVLVHLPMEPKGYPDVRPGPGALLVGMTADEIRETTARNLSLLPGAIGVNNHMGSRFTENAPAMHVALAEMKRRGLFFLDSLTSGRSAGSATAHELGLRHYVRDVFIDNVAEVPAILVQLRKAEALARSSGTAIAIGHPHSATLQALRQWSAALDGRVRVVRLSELPARQ